MLEWMENTFYILFLFQKQPKNVFAMKVSRESFDDFYLRNNLNNSTLCCILK